MRALDTGWTLVARSFGATRREIGHVLASLVHVVVAPQRARR